MQNKKTSMRKYKKNYVFLLSYLHDLAVMSLLCCKCEPGITALFSPVHIYTINISLLYKTNPGIKLNIHSGEGRKKEEGKDFHFQLCRKSLCGLSRQCKIQNLDPRHNPMNGFVSGLPLPLSLTHNPSLLKPDHDTHDQVSTKHNMVFNELTHNHDFQSQNSRKSCYNLLIQHHLMASHIKCTRCYQSYPF